MHASYCAYDTLALKLLILLSKASDSWWRVVKSYFPC